MVERMMERESHNCREVAAAVLTQGFINQHTPTREENKTPEGFAKLVEPTYRRMLEMVSEPLHPSQALKIIPEGRIRLEMRDGKIQAVIALEGPEILDLKESRPNLWDGLEMAEAAFGS